MNRESTVRKLLLVGLLLCTWYALAPLLAPVVIAGVVQNPAVAKLATDISDKDLKPAEYYIQKWNDFATWGPVCVLVLVLIALATRSPRFVERHITGATPGSIGAIRCLAAAILLISALWEDLPSSAWLPREMERPSGALELLYALPIGFARFTSNEQALGVFQWLTRIVLFLAVIGWRTRIVVPLAALCYLILGGILRQYAWFYHTGLIPTYVLAVLSLTPCGDAWSVDRLLKLARGQPATPTDQPAIAFGWGRYMCWVVIALPYLAAGLSKVRNGGFDWFEPNTMRAILYKSSLNPMHFDWGLPLHMTAAPDWLFILLSLFAVATEVGFVLVLFSRVARKVVPLLTIGMHLGIFFLQDILFFDLILLQLLFFNYDTLRQGVARWVGSSRGTCKLVFDGDCPLCRRAIRVLSSLDLLERLEPVDFRQLDLDSFNRNYQVQLSRDALEAEMAVIAGQRVKYGFIGYRALAAVIPAFWPLVPVLWLPGMTRLGTLVYRLIAERRRQLVRCDSSCAGAPPVASLTLVSGGTERGYRRLVLAFAVLLVTCWLGKVEFYPLTAMQMFSEAKTSGTITYYRVLAHYESGQVREAEIGEWIGAMADARYRRVIETPFKRGKERVGERFLTTCARVHNERARLGAQIVGMEVQKWEWDFCAEPKNPQFGRVAARYFCDVPIRR